MWIYNVSNIKICFSFKVVDKEDMGCGKVNEERMGKIKLWVRKRPGRT